MGHINLHRVSVKELTLQGELTWHSARTLKHSLRGSTARCQRCMVRVG